MSKLLTSATAIVAAAALTITLVGPATAKTVDPVGQPITNAVGQTFRVLAHRGGATQWPENSIEAFVGAAAAGYDGIETDIAFTADGVAVMSHYDLLPVRCTSAGSRIHKLSWAKVSAVRCADSSGKKSVPIPRFADLAKVLNAHPGVGLTLDIKTYSGQSKAGKRLYATKAVKLVKQYGLTNRTRYLTYNWDVALPSIRKLAPKAYVLAYDHNGFDYDRVRLAAKLGASGYGTEARFTSVNLAQLIKSKGMEVVPWNIKGTQAQAFAIFHGPTRNPQWFMTDNPAALTAQLVGETAKLNWTATDQVTTLTKPVTISKSTYSAKRNKYPKILGPAVPANKLAALKTVTVSITLTKGPSKNYAYLAARSSASASRIKVSLPRSGTRVVSVPVGDSGRIRLQTTKKSKLTVKVLGYTNQVFVEKR